MSDLFKKLYQKAGLDSAITFTILTRVVQSIGVLVTLLLIAHLLDKNQQGYFYTFLSIASIRIFFELGITGILTQYVAHEAAHLSWKNGFELTGDEYYLSRLGSIIHLAVKGFSVLTLLLFITLLLAGNIFFTTYNAELNVNWQLPWVVLCVSTCLILLLDLLFALFEGLGKVRETAQLRLVQQIVNLVFLTIFLLTDLQLLAYGLALLISNLAIVIWMTNRGFFATFKNLWRIPISSKINYREEVLPFQFRIALGSISTYFVFQFFSPVLFATQGAVVAGQMGATQTFLNGIGIISISWITTKIPLFSNLVATKKFDDLNLNFRRSTIISVIVCLAGLVFFMAFLSFLKLYYPSLAQRFLPIVPVLFLGFTQLANVIGTSQGYYLRSFKKDPFFVSSIVIGLLTGISTVVCSKYFDVTGIAIGCFLVNGVLGLLWGTIIFYNKKREWSYN